MFWLFVFLIVIFIGLCYISYKVGFYLLFILYSIIDWIREKLE